MLAEDAVYIILRDDAGVGALAGNSIHGGVLPNPLIGGFPTIIYRGEERGRVETLEGGVALVSPQRIALYSVAQTYKTAAELRDAIEAALHEFSGDVTNDESPSTTFQVQGIFLVSHDYRKDDEGVQGRPGLNLHEFLSVYDVHFLPPTA